MYQNHPSFWYFLRRFKKALRTSYAMDVQTAYEKGLQEGIKSDKVRELARQQWQDGHAQGVYNGLVRIVCPNINVAPSPYTPTFVIKLLKEVQDDFGKLKKNVCEYQNLVKKLQREGTFKVKNIGHNEIVLKEIYQTRIGKRSRSKDLEDDLAEIERMRKWKKFKLIKPVDPDAKKGIGTKSSKK
eukprot:TRINITY_DN442_c0_g1_i1.p1 TRINITY_DN442_c0_g1~~TRINITY_DN442_c0_g1_i1.p1  ORF type:complete len:185 (+),score=36.40 TRINITY_DN442_c0_g1_i1:183-737(+)